MCFKLPAFLAVGALSSNCKEKTKHDQIQTDSRMVLEIDPSFSSHMYYILIYTRKTHNPSRQNAYDLPLQERLAYE
jgi:hypothetical protein